MRASGLVNSRNLAQARVVRAEHARLGLVARADEQAQAAHVGDRGEAQDELRAVGVEIGLVDAVPGRIAGMLIGPDEVADLVADDASAIVQT